MQVIYDEEGTVFFQGSGFPTPEGALSYMSVTVPERHFLKGIDTTKTPAEPIFEEYPKSEMELLKEKVAALEENQTAMLEGAGILAEGGTDHE